MAEFRNPKDILQEFNSTVRALIVRLERKTRSEEELCNLDRLKKRINLLRSTMGDDAPLTEAAPFMIEHGNRIVQRDETFFNTCDVRAEYLKTRGAVDPKDEFVFGLIDSVRVHYNKATQAEKDEAYEEVRTLLRCCTEYQLGQA